jgi:prevent-host-death family protein
MAKMEAPIMASVTLTASEFQERVGDALDRSLSQPVVITKHGRPRNVVLSYSEYERLSARDRRVVLLEDWTAEDVALLAEARMESGFEVFDAELEAK